ncbi:MAG: F0F1 ATP synthase subunit A, partial [Chloroflexi bacterium]|nr:F0F1 ATP synthase subunit A [Chloroflexota bacterium]
LKEHGFRYLGKFFNFAPFLGSLSKMVTRKMKFSVLSLLTDAISIGVGFLELLSELIRIISFTFRLFGNMTAGEILLLVVTFLVPWLVALPFYGLELLVGFVQALIFGGLTLVFLTMAVVAHGEESHESH